MNREQLIKDLYKLRKQGWEKPCLPYGLPFREDSATDYDLEKHVVKIKQHKKSVINSRILFILKAIGLIIVLLIILFK